jgi:hypothetical protein
MMATIFATILLAFVSGWRRHGRWSLLFFFASLALASALFLYEIYSPEYGFRMPWIQTHDTRPPADVVRG